VALLGHENLGSQFSVQQPEELSIRNGRYFTRASTKSALGGQSRMGGRLGASSDDGLGRRGIQGPSEERLKAASARSSVPLALRCRSSCRRETFRNRCRGSSECPRWPEVRRANCDHCEVRQAIASISAFAPFHNRAELEGIEMMEQLLGSIPQVAVFDTGFHHNLPPSAAVYPGLYEWLERGIRRYGFHGINHQDWAERTA
jgi:hypothetical protein